MADYLDIRALQEPFDLGPDASGRAQWTFNITVIKSQSDTFAEEVVGLLTDGGVTDIYVVSTSKIPAGDGPFTVVIETGGTSGLRVHDQLMPKWPRPAARIVVHATDPRRARQVCRLAHNALAGVRNATVTP